MLYKTLNANYIRDFLINCHHDVFKEKILHYLYIPSVQAPNWMGSDCSIICVILNCNFVYLITTFDIMKFDDVLMLLYDCVCE